MNAPLLELDKVAKRFARKPDIVERMLGGLGMAVANPVVHAIDDVSLALYPGEFVGLVGESGCGKSTLGRIVAGIHDASSGKVRLHGQDVTALDGEARRKAFLKVQMIFQDPYSSLNPRMRVRDIVGEAPLVHGLCTKAEAEDYVGDVLRRVGLDASTMDRFPHQFSGGQRQRVSIARALAVRPDLIVCDESVAALDVSIQAQVLNLFMQLRADTGATWLFISHDLGVVEHVCDRVIIMYLGRVVESGRTIDIYTDPKHPYTRALLDDLPRLDRRNRAFAPVQGEIPSPMDPPPGCHFHPRCPLAGPRCQRERPFLKPVGESRLAACHLHDGGVA